MSKLVSLKSLFWFFFSGFLVFFCFFCGFWIFFVFLVFLVFGFFLVFFWVFCFFWVFLFFKVFFWFFHVSTLFSREKIEKSSRVTNCLSRPKKKTLTQVGSGLGPRRAGVTVQHGDAFQTFFSFSSFILCPSFFFLVFSFSYSNLK